MVCTDPSSVRKMHQFVGHGDGSVSEWL